jgi:Xaa-Pro aminopeptidase
MALAGIDFLVLTSRSNFEYFTDHKTLTWAYHARPLFAVITPAKLAVIASRAEARNIEMRERPFAASYYDGYLKEATDTVIQTIVNEDADARGVVALDYGQDHFGRGSLELVQELQARGRVVSGADLIWRVRAIKSLYEVALKRASFAIVNSAFDEAIAEARIGMTEVDLLRQIQSGIILKGAERADPIAMLFSKGDFIYNRLAGDRKLEEGHTIWTDFRSTYGGYPADRNRIARAGEPSAWEIRTYATIRSLTMALCKSARPGMTGRDLYARYADLWRDADLGSAYNAISRVGHGGGLDVTEPPSISATSTEVLRDGMIIHLEPKLEANGAVFQFEEIVLIRERGIEFLSEPHPDSIPVVPVR